MKTSNRRFLGLLGTVALAGALVPGLASAQTQSKAKKDRVVFQMSDNDPAKWGLALNNMRNVQVEIGEEYVDVDRPVRGSRPGRCVAFMIESARMTTV